MVNGEKYEDSLKLNQQIRKHGCVWHHVLKEVNYPPQVGIIYFLKTFLKSKGKAQHLATLWIPCFTTVGLFPFSCLNFSYPMGCALTLVATTR